MKHNTYFLNILLCGILGLVLLVWVLVRTFLPAAVLPQLNIPAMTLVSLAALLLEFFLAPGARRSYLWIFLLSAVTFGLLPLAAGMAAVAECWKLAVVGGLVFTAVTWLFSSMANRLSAGGQSRAAVILSALILFLAVQSFTGMLL